MYLSAERMALANQAVQETFEQTSIAWQAIPHWDTGDPGQIRVRNDILEQPGLPGPRASSNSEFQVTVVQASAPTPTHCSPTVMAETVDLAKAVDDAVLPELRAKAAGA